MKRALSIAVVIAALPAGAAVAGVTGGDGGLPGCKPSGYHPQKCCPQGKHGELRAHWRQCPPGGTTTTVTEPGTTTTVTTVQTVTAPGTTVTVTTPAPPPTVIVTPGPTSTTVNVTITVNGVPQTVTVPGSMPGTLPACVNTRKSAVLGPLPLQFKPGMRVAITSNGHAQFATVMGGRRVNVNLSALPCGVYPIAIRHPGLKPAWRIWSLTGGNRLTRFWFPGLPGVSTF